MAASRPRNAGKPETEDETTILQDTDVGRQLDAITMLPEADGRTTFAPPCDILQELEDKRVIQVAAAGVPVNVAQAQHEGIWELILKQSHAFAGKPTEETEDEPTNA